MISIRNFYSKKNLLLKLYLVAIFIFCFSLPFDIGFSNVSIIIFVIYSIFYVSKNGFAKKPNSLFITFAIAFVLFFLLYVISFLFSSIDNPDIRIIEHRLSFLFIPIILYFNYRIVSKKIVFVTVIKGFLIGNLFAGLINLALALKNSIRNINGEWVFDSSVWGNQTPFWFSIDHIGNYFFSIHFSNFIHPSYWAMYLVFAIGIIWYLIENNYIKNQLFYIILGCFFIFLIFLLSSRAGYVILIIVLGLLILKSFFMLRKVSYISYAFLALFLVLVSALIFNPRAYSLIENYGKLHDGSTNQRINSWVASLEIIKEYPIKGVGVNNTEIYLMKKYQELNFIENYKEHYNAHNQYLEVQLGLGILGIILLLAIVIGGLISSITSGSFLLTIFILITALSFIFESMLNRYHGIVFYTFFYLFLVANFNKKKSAKIPD